MHLAGSDLEVDAPQDLLAVDGRMQIFTLNISFLFYIRLSDRTLEAYRKQFLRLDGKFHRQFGQHLAGVAVDDQSHGILGRKPALIAVEKLVSEIFDVVASCSTTAVRLRLSITGKVCAPHLSPISSESHCE